MTEPPETVFNALTRRNQVLMKENQDLREQVALLQQRINEQRILEEEADDLRNENNMLIVTINNIHNDILQLTNRENTSERSFADQIEENLYTARQQRDQFIRSIEQTHEILITYFNRDNEGNPIEQTEVLLEELINQHQNLRGENQQLIRDIERREGIPEPTEEDENPFEENPKEIIVDFGELQEQYERIIRGIKEQ